MAEGYAFGVSQFTTWPWTFDHDLRAYAELGVDAIEVCEFKLAPGHYAEQLAQIQELGLAVASVQTTIHSIFKDSLQGEPPDPDHRLARMKDSMSSIAPYVPPRTPFVVITGAAPAGNCAQALDVAKALLPQLAQHAATLDMRLAFEPLNPVLFNTDTAVWSLADALTLVEHIDHPALGLCVDLWNVWQTPNLLEVIERAGSKIFLVQTSDWRVPRASADRRSIGEGVIPIGDILAAIRRTGYALPYVLEIFSTQSLPDSLWNGDLTQTLRHNMRTFNSIWNRVVAAA